MTLKMFISLRIWTLSHFPIIVGLLSPEHLSFFSNLNESILKNTLFSRKRRHSIIILIRKNTLFVGRIHYNGVFRRFNVSHQNVL